MPRRFGGRLSFNPALSAIGRKQYNSAAAPSPITVMDAGGNVIKVIPAQPKQRPGMSDAIRNAKRNRRKASKSSTAAKIAVNDPAA